MTRLVADSSFTLAWYLEDEESEYADAAHAALTNVAEAIVPPLWPYEVANGLWMAERRGRLQAADIPRVLGLLSPLPIEVESTGYERTRQEVLELARREAITAYDAAYVELAMRHGIALASLDRSLRDAARRVGVTLYQPSEKGAAAEWDAVGAGPSTHGTTRRHLAKQAAEVTTTNLADLLVSEP